MSDNTTLDAGAGGDTIATDDIGGVKHQQIKMEWGVDGTATPVSAANPIPTVQTGALPAGANAIGKLAANSGVDIGDVDVTSAPGTVADGAAGLPAVLYVVGGWDGTNVQALATDATGLLQVDVATAPTTAVTGPLTDAQLRAVAVPVSGTVTANLAAGTNNIGDVDVLTLPANASVNQAQVAGTTTDTNSGNKSAGTQRVVLATDQPALTNALKVDGSAVTQPVSGTVTINAIPAGNNNIGDVDIASIAAGNNNIGDVDVASIAAGTNAIGNVGIVPRTTGGLTTFHLVSAASTNATNVKASAGQLFGWYIYNSNAAARKVTFHNSAGTPTAGASVFFSVVIPPTSAANVFSETGIAFGTGIAITMVTGLADSDSTGVAVNDLVCNLFYA